jgi:uncharacterized protein (DUF1810 family)
MWFVFPQMLGLGSSATAREYAIESAEEARAYLAHPVLGKRLDACVRALLDIEGRSAFEIFSTPDDLKLRSCATLFAQVSPEGSIFHALLDQYFDRRPDPRTLEILRRST